MTRRSASSRFPQAEREQGSYLWCSFPRECCIAACNHTAHFYLYLFVAGVVVVILGSVDIVLGEVDR